MKGQLLEELIEAQHEHLARVLATNLDTNEQVLLAPLDEDQNPDVGAWPLAEAHRQG